MSLSPRERVLAALRAGALGNVLQRAKKVEKVEMNENSVSICFCELGTHAFYKDCAKYLAEARAGERELAEQMRRTAEGGEGIQRQRAETLEAALHLTRARLMATEKALLKEQGRGIGDAAYFDGVVEKVHDEVEHLKTERDAAIDHYEVTYPEGFIASGRQLTQGYNGLPSKVMQDYNSQSDACRAEIVKSRRFIMRKSLDTRLVELQHALERQKQLEAENVALRKEQRTVLVMLQSAVIQNSKPEHAERARSYPEPWLIGRLQGLIWEARTEALEAAAEHCERVRERWHRVEGTVAETRAETARELRDTILNIKQGQSSQGER